MKFSAQAKSTLMRIQIILDNISTREVKVISPEKMQEVEDYLKFGADWLYKAYRAM